MYLLYVYIINVMFRRDTRNNYTRHDNVISRSSYYLMRHYHLLFRFVVLLSLKMTNRSFYTITTNDFNNIVITVNHGYIYSRLYDYI